MSDENSQSETPALAYEDLEGGDSQGMNPATREASENSRSEFVVNFNEPTRRRARPLDVPDEKSIFTMTVSLWRQ